MIDMDTAVEPELYSTMVCVFSVIEADWSIFKAANVNRKMPVSKDCKYLPPATHLEEPLHYLQAARSSF